MILRLLMALGAVGAWHITDKTSQLDGHHSYHALLYADGTVANISDRPEKPTLGIDCDKDELYLGIDWPDVVHKSAGDIRVTVGWKIDDGAVHRDSWLAADQVVALTGKAAFDMIRQLSTAKRLVVSIPDAHGGQEAVFILNGVNDVGNTVERMNCRA